MFSARFFIDYNIVFGTDYQNYVKLKNGDWSIGKMIYDKKEKFDLVQLSEMIGTGKQKEALRLIDHQIRLERMATEFSKVSFQQLDPMYELF